MNHNQRESKLSPSELLSALWVFVMLNYLYADVMSLMDPVAKALFSSKFYPAPTNGNLERNQTNTSTSSVSTNDDKALAAEGFQAMSPPGAAPPPNAVGVRLATAAAIRSWNSTLGVPTSRA